MEGKKCRIIATYGYDLNMVSPFENGINVFANILKLSKLGKLRYIEMQKIMRKNFKLMIQ